MLEQLSTAIRFHCFLTVDKVGQAGLTVTVDVYDAVDAKVVSNGVVTDVGGGLYAYTLAMGFTAVAGEYRAVFKTTSDDVAQKHIPAIWVVGKPSGLSNLLRIGSASVVVVSPIGLTGDVVVIAGDDYLNADGRAIDFTLAASSVTWPDLTSAVVTLRYRKMSGGAVLTKTMTVVTPTGASATVRLELTKAITETLSGKYKYDVEAVLANTRVVTLISGSLLVVDDI